MKILESFENFFRLYESVLNEANRFTIVNVVKKEYTVVDENGNKYGKEDFYAHIMRNERLKALYDSVQDYVPVSRKTLDHFISYCPMYRQRGMEILENYHFVYVRLKALRAALQQKKPEKKRVTHYNVTETIKELFGDNHAMYALYLEMFLPPNRYRYFCICGSVLKRIVANLCMEVMKNV